MNDEANDVQNQPKYKWHRRNAVNFLNVLNELFHESTATGEFATAGIPVSRIMVSSTPVPSGVRKRGIGLVQAVDDDDEEPRRRQRLNPGTNDTKLEQTLTSINMYLMGKNTRTQGKSKTEQAVAIFEAEYTSRLLIEDQVDATLALQQGNNAEVFLSLQRGQLRDKWLERVAKVALDVVVSD